MKPHPLLAPLSPLYRSGVAVRNWLFDAGLLATTKIPCKVISVGNLSVGGTGKTPFVIWLAKWFSQRRYRVGVLSRGYARSSNRFLLVSNGKKRLASVQEAGDEPCEIADQLPGVFVAVDEDRVRGGRQLLKHHRLDVLLLDDGFQHRAIHRDLNIVVFPSEELEGPNLLLPAGYYREPLANLKRADLIVVTRCAEIDELAAAQQLFGKRGPIIAMKTVPDALRTMDGKKRKAVRNARGRNVLALSGIGRPDSFERILSGAGFNLVGHEVFPDHHPFTGWEVESVFHKARVLGARMIVTTAKDAVRLRDLAIAWEKAKPEMLVLETRQEMFAGRRLLEKVLLTIKK
jgi:tetraacyldisaccharide 4'-kinase